MVFVKEKLTDVFSSFNPDGGKMKFFFKIAAECNQHLY